MLDIVSTLARRPNDYESIVGGDLINETADLAQRLAGRRILHVNATAFGGGVVELLASAVPLTKALGLEVDWRVITGSDSFFEVTKSMHNALQGQEVPWDADIESTYLDQVRSNAEAWIDGYDIVVIHDPQPAAILSLLTELRGQRPSGIWIWRCHIDLTTRFAPVWDFLRPHVEAYDAAVFTMPEFVPDDLDVGVVRLIPPCIDPLAVKNIDLPRDVGRAFLRAFGLDDGRPVLTQVSRFDPWKDPKGVIDSYRVVKEAHPGVQLLLAGSMASDDPEGVRLYDETSTYAGDDPDIHLLTNLDGVGAAEINAFQTGSEVVIQKSLREGFGLTVTEGMWKRRPLVGGDVGGIRIQIEDGVSGYLVDSVEMCAARVSALLADPARADAMGEAGREHVRTTFTTPHLVRNWLQLMADLASV
ncbi:MAG: glycosyltransferase [Acidimicrobiia bacterium]